MNYKECPMCEAQVEPDMDDCPDCGYGFNDNDADDTQKKEAVLSADARKHLSSDKFLYVDPKTGRKWFPVPDKEHVAKAIQLLPRAKLPDSVKATIRSKLKKLATHYGIDMSESKSKQIKPIELVEVNEVPILLEQKEDNYHYAKFLVTTIGERNKNGRVYPESVIARELSQPMKGDILGQDTHPTGDHKFTNQFLIWQSFMREGDKEFAVAKVVPTKPDGENFIMLAQAGAMASCSRRGMGSVKEGKVNGQKAMIVQDDYQIMGIDILPPHVQSDHNAYLQTFEAYTPEESNTMDELTLESLREGREDLVKEIEESVTKPLQEQVTTLQTEVESLTKAKDEQVALAQDNATKLTESETKAQEVSTKLDEATAQVAELTTKLDEAAKQAETLTEALHAQKHLLAKVKGNKAAWLILDELKDTASVADVDAKFDEASTKCNALIENAGIPPAGRAVNTSNENDELEEAKKKDQESKTKEDARVMAMSRQVAKRSGIL